MESCIRYVTIDILVLIISILASIAFILIYTLFVKLFMNKRYIVNCYDLKTGNLKKTIHFFTTEQVDKFVSRNRDKYKVVVRDTLEIF